jgi:4-amino-4-deoxy-L-arabinose transferase-like glycosyltransferase
VCVYIGAFSLAKTKLPSYITPMYPGLALLGACFVHHWVRNALQVAMIWPRLAMGCLAAVGCGMIIGLPIAAYLVAPGEEFLGVLGLAPLVTAGVCMFCMRRGHSDGAARVFGFQAVLVTTLILGFLPVRADRHQHSDVLLKAIAARSRDPEIATLGRLEPSWVFYAHRPLRAITPQQLHDQPDGVFAAGREAFVITTRRQLQKLKTPLPDDVHVIAEAPLFLRKEQLVVLAREPGQHATAANTTHDDPKR